MPPKFKICGRVMFSCKVCEEIKPVAEEGRSLTKGDLSDLTFLRDGVCGDCWGGLIDAELDKVV